MKSYSSILIKPLLFGSLLLLGACKESFFDQRPYDSIPVEQAITNETDMQAAVNGMYSAMRNVDLYGRSFPVIGDVMADNVYISALNSGRYIQYQNYSVTVTQTEASNMWTAGYSAILRANNIINAKVTQTDLTKQLVGEALAVRGLVHFDLLRAYSKIWDQNAAGIPIVLQFDQNSRPGRAKVSEVFDQVIKDLTQAFDMMTTTARATPYNNSSYLAKYAAKALLARVYLYKGDYKNAQTAAEDVVKNGGYSLIASTDLVNYWANAVPRTDKVETIFEISADNVGNLGTNALAYMYEQAGYGDLLATNSLYTSYSATDARKQLIKTGKRGGQDVLIVAKYSNTTNSNDKDDIKIIRYAEVLLTLAETQYRNGNVADALVTLNTFVKRRDPSFAGYTSTGTQVLEDILNERRKELAFEGDRFYDLNRLNRAISRGVQYPTNVQTIAADDTRRVAPIPQVERDANPGIEQNSGY